MPGGFSAPLTMAATESPIFSHWLSRFREQGDKKLIQEEHGDEETRRQFIYCRSLTAGKYVSCRRTWCLTL